MAPFPEFLTQVTNAFERYVPSGHAKYIIIKQLILEGLNTVTHNSIVPVRNEDIHKWVLAAHDIDTQNRPISALMASINPLVNAKLGKNENFVLPVHTAGDVHSLVTYIGIVPGLIQRRNALNTKRAIIGHETVDAPNIF